MNFDLAIAIERMKTLDIGNEKIKRPGKELDANQERNRAMFGLHEHPFVKSCVVSDITQALNLIAESNK